MFGAICEARSFVLMNLCGMWSWICFEMFLREIGMLGAANYDFFFPFSLMSLGQFVMGILSLLWICVEW